MDNKIPVLSDLKELKESIEVHSGNYSLVDSNSIILFDPNIPLEIEEMFDDSFRVTIRFLIEKDDANPGQHISVNVKTDTNTVEYLCLNFDSPFGTGTVKPIEMGVFNEKKIYIHFWIYLLGQHDKVSRKLEYSIWKER